MKKHLKGFFLSLGIIFMLSACNNEKITTMENNTFNNATSEQLSGIRKALDAYIEAAVKGDSKIAEPVFTSNATISHIGNNPTKTRESKKK